ADHGRRHHREGEDAGREEVDRVVRPGGQHVDDAEEHQQPDRDGDDEQQLLAVAAEELQLGAQLGRERGHRPSPPVRRRNTPSRLAAPARTSITSAPVDSSQADTAERADGPGSSTTYSPPATSRAGAPATAPSAPASSAPRTRTRSSRRDPRRSSR